MIRPFILFAALTSVLVACASPEELAKMSAVHDREFPPAVEACADHMLEQQVDTAKLIAAGFTMTEAQTYRKEFTDLDTALSARGALDLTLSEGCEFFMPAHVGTPGSLYQFMLSEIKRRGLQETTVPVGLLELEAKAYTDGEITLLMRGGYRNTILLGYVSAVSVEKI